VDAVSSMLYLDYGREGDFVRNEKGGNIDFAAVDFLRKLNRTLLTKHEGAVTIAEESTSYPLVTMPPDADGLGFSYKWNMGYMHDTLSYMETDPYFRGGGHDKMTFSMYYAFSENFILPYSHDEVVHGKKSMIEKMYGGYDEKFAALKTLYAWTYAQPGKKLLFMGGEFAQFIEWDYRKELDWVLLGYDSHRGTQDFVRKLNACYRAHPALYENDADWDGFSWLVVDDRERNVFAFMRTSRGAKPEHLICVFNFSGVAYKGYRINLPFAGRLTRLLDSSSGAASARIIKSVKTPVASLTLPPLSAQYYLFKAR
jgi:1,4-alpha-glucan branching enzyme